MMETARKEVVKEAYSAISKAEQTIVNVKPNTHADEIRKIEEKLTALRDTLVEKPKDKPAIKEGTRQLSEEQKGLATALAKEDDEARIKEAALRPVAVSAETLAQAAQEPGHLLDGLGPVMEPQNDEEGKLAATTPQSEQGQPTTQEPANGGVVEGERKEQSLPPKPDEEKVQSTPPKPDEEKGKVQPLPSKPDEEKEAVQSRPPPHPERKKRPGSEQIQEVKAPKPVGT